MRILIGLSLCFAALGATIYLMAETPLAGSKWAVEACMTNSCVKDTLDGLCCSRANYAKLTTWGSITYVWYQYQD